jgi:hypothetical protein
MQYACRYLYDVHRQEQPQSHDTLENWRQEWTCNDQSANSPRQRNSDDCGIFALVSMSLLSNGTILRQDSYSQSIIYDRQTRRRIAYLTWASGIDHPTTPWIANSTNPHAPGARNRARAGCATSKTVEKPRRKRKRKEQRMVLGGVRIRRKLTSTTYTDRTRPRQLLNRKRSTASIADELAQPPPTTQRQIPARKRARQDTPTGPHQASTSNGG